MCTKLIRILHRHFQLATTTITVVHESVCVERESTIITLNFASLSALNKEFTDFSILSCS